MCSAPTVERLRPSRIGHHACQDRFPGRAAPARVADALADRRDDRRDCWLSTGAKMTIKGVGLLVGEGELDRLAVLGRPGRRDHVHGIDVLAAGGRNAPSRARVSGENGGTVQPRGLAGVDGENTGPAGIGDDGDTASGRQGLRLEAGGDVEHLVDRVGADDAGLVEERVDGDVVCGEGRGVTARGTGSAARAARPSRRRSAWCGRCGAPAARTGAGSRTTRDRAG
jgi:hypothetical protein